MKFICVRRECTRSVHQIILKSSSVLRTSSCRAWLTWLVFAHACVGVPVLFVCLIGNRVSSAVSSLVVLLLRFIWFDGKARYAPKKKCKKLKLLHCLAAFNKHSGGKNVSDVRLFSESTGLFSEKRFRRSGSAPEKIPAPEFLEAGNQIQGHIAVSLNAFSTHAVVP